MPLDAATAGGQRNGHKRGSQLADSGTSAIHRQKHSVSREAARRSPGEHIPHKSVIQPEVEPCEIISGQELALALGENILDAIEGLEHLCHGFVVSGLLRGEAGSVHTIVEHGIDPAIQLLQRGCVRLCTSNPEAISSERGPSSKRHTYPGWRRRLSTAAFTLGKRVAGFLARLLKALSNSFRISKLSFETMVFS